jgi:hypothetical protein
MRTDGQTDMTKLIVAFRNFANAPKAGRDTDSQVPSCVSLDARDLMVCSKASRYA